MDPRNDRPASPRRISTDAVVSLLGRVLFGGFFLYNGVNHFVNLETMAGYAASKGVPSPSLAIALSGVLLLLGGLSILLGFWTRLGAWLLVLFLVPTSLLIHNFWALPDPQAASIEMTQFMKNLALIGASLMIATVPSWPLSLDSRIKR